MSVKEITGNEKNKAHKQRGNVNRMLKQKMKNTTSLTDIKKKKKNEIQKEAQRLKQMEKSNTLR